MTVKITIEAHAGIGPVRPADLSRDLTVPMAAAAQAADEFVSQRFETETDYDGNAWYPIAEPWASKRKKGKILTQGSALRISYTVQGDSTGLTIRAGMEYANRQNYGGGGVHARPVVGAGFGLKGPSAELMQDIDDTILDWIEMEFAK